MEILKEVTEGFMMRVLAVYGIDSSYGERFADYVNQKEKIPFTAMAFSNLEKLLQYSEEHTVEILLVDEEAREQVRDVKAKPGDGALPGGTGGTKGGAAVHLQVSVGRLCHA